MASSGDLVNTSADSSRYIFRNCRLPSSWTGSPNAASGSAGQDIQVLNCDDGDTNYRIWTTGYIGDVKSETTIVKDSGASDGTTQLSWNMTSGANAEWNHESLVSPEIVKWNETTGSSVTVTVDFIHDSLTALQDDEIWLEVQYLGTSGFPLSVFADDAAADYLATPANQTTSSSTWTTTGLTNPNEQQVNVSFTPQEKGFIHAKVHLAKASYTVYVDPELVVS